MYAPVTPAFRPMTPDQRRVVRDGLDVGDGPLIVTVKRLHPVAGYETLLRAIPQILSDHPDATFALIGEGELRGRLEAHAREAGVSARVKFLGRIDHQSISQYYAAADVFVLPSNVESWGTVMLEALASGTPVVATDTSGGVEVREHFGDDVTIVEKRDSGGTCSGRSSGAPLTARHLWSHGRTSSNGVHRSSLRSPLSRRVSPSRWGALMPTGIRKIGRWLFVMTLALYGATTGGSMATDIMSYEVTKGIVESGTVAMSGNIFNMDAHRGVDGRYYAPYGIGHAVYSIPFYLAGRAAESWGGMRIAQERSAAEGGVRGRQRRRGRADRLDHVSVRVAADGARRLCSEDRPDPGLRDHPVAVCQVRIQRSACGALHYRRDIRRVGRYAARTGRRCCFLAAPVSAAPCWCGTN